MPTPLEGQPANPEALDALFANEGSPVDPKRESVQKPRVLTKRELRKLFRDTPTKGGKPMTSTNQLFRSNAAKEGFRFRVIRKRNPR